MRTLQDHLDTLALNYLNNTSLVSEETGSIRESAITTCISALNAGILTIHARVTLRLKNIQVDRVDGIKQYKLSEVHTQRAKDEYDLENDPLDPGYIPYPYTVYITESDDLLADDILTLRDIKDDCGRTIYPRKVALDIIEIDWDKFKTNYITVEYRSKGTKIPYDASGDTVIDYPAIGLPALEFYAAQQLLLSIGTENANYTARQYLMQYEQAILHLSENILTDDQQYAEDKFNRTGWV